MRLVKESQSYPSRGAPPIFRGFATGGKRTGQRLAQAKPIV